MSPTAPSRRTPAPRSRLITPARPLQLPRRLTHRLLTSRSLSRPLLLRQLARQQALSHSTTGLLQWAPVHLALARRPTRRVPWVRARIRLLLLTVATPISIPAPQPS